MRYFNILDKKWTMMMDKVLFGVGGAVHLLPEVLSPIASFTLGPITVQMLVGGLMVARFVDMMMK